MIRGHSLTTRRVLATGRQPCLAAFREGGGADNESCREPGFREREPDDREVHPGIAESVAFWAPNIDTGAEDLR